MSDWITIDGSSGEGGGQMLRTALALSLVTGRPFRIDQIRAKRQKPGLLRQHLTAVHAAAAVGRARIAGDDLGSPTLTFEPGAVHGGDYHWSVGTAGSATLVLQAVLPALMTVRERSELTLEGGTHNPNAPPFDFLARTFLPLVGRMGATIDSTLERHGFYPAGGGRFCVSVTPCRELERLSILERGPVQLTARAMVAALPESIARREASIVRERLGIDRECCHVETVRDSIGPGNIVMIAIEGAAVTEIVTGFGVKGVSAGAVAGRAAEEAATLIAADVPVGPHLADQLLLPMALAGGGEFRTLEPTAHAVSNAAVIRAFTSVPILFAHEQGNVYRVSVGTHARGSSS
jgi:RNA 3'-terminal phosphate cyclase (ATP)